MFIRPDQPFHHFTASESVDRRFHTGFISLMDGFEALKFLKGQSGACKCLLSYACAKYFFG